MELGSIRERWLKDQQFYDRLGQQVRISLSDALHRRGVKGCRVQYRSKTLNSMIKKVLKKRIDYDQIYDKVGLRIVTRFTGQLSLVEEVVHELFTVKNRDDKADRLAPYESGYLSVHYDVQLKGLPANLPEYHDEVFEVQVRSLCQDVWADMSHSLLYKSPVDLPNDLSRRVFSLGALLELCDREFQDLFTQVQAVPGESSSQLLIFLEECFFRFAVGDHDQELSLEVLNLLSPLLPHTGSATPVISEWVDEKSKNLQEVYTVYENFRDRWAFLFQPESILLFYLLELDRFSLVELWVQRFPFDELEGLAAAWGISLDDGW